MKKIIITGLLSLFVGSSFANTAHILPKQELQKMNANHKVKKHKPLKEKTLLGHSITVVKDKYIPLSKQVRTPISINTRNMNLHRVPKAMFGSSSCWQLVQQSGGQNYTTTINSTQWWSTGNITFSVQNTCNTAQNPAGIVIDLSNLLMNGAAVSNLQVSQPSGTLSSPNTPYTNIIAVAGLNPTLTVQNPNGTTTSCTNGNGWACVNPNNMLTYSVDVSTSSPIVSLTVGSVALAGATPTPQPPNTGQLNITIDATALQAPCQSTSCNIQMQLVDATGNVVESGSINPATTATEQVTFQNLLPGTYTMQVISGSIPALSGLTVNTIYNPSANIAVTNNTISTGEIDFTVQNTIVQSTLNINLANVFQASTFANIGLMKGQAIDKTTNAVTPFQIGLGGSTSLTQLTAGHSYTLQIQGIADPATAVYYAPFNQTVSMPSNGTPVTLNLTYSATPSSVLQSTTFTEKMSNGGLLPTSPLSLQFGSTNNYYKYNTDTLLNSGTFAFDQADSIAVTTSAPIGYSVSSTNPFVISTTVGGSIPAQTITLQALASGSLMVGYLSNSYGIGSSVYTQISQAAQAGYNVVVIAFAMLQNTTPMTWYGDQFLAYTSWQTFGTCPQAINYMTQDIANAKQYYGLKYAIASVGGANSTFDISQVSTTQQIQTMAQNIVSFLQQYSLDGIDFDIEQPMNGTTFAQLLAAIKAINPNIIISAPPQANSVGAATTDVAFVTTATDQDYTQAIQGGYFNYLWLQAYNTGNTSNQIMYNGVLTDETMPEYIPAAYFYFLGQLSAQPPVTVPSNTRFIIGEPSQIDAGGLATVWHNPNYSSTTAVYQALAQNYQAISAQSNGAMTWSINQDIDAGCQFASNVGKVFGITNISCPTNGDSYHGSLNPNNC